MSADICKTASIARILPTTHTLALLRYGVLGHRWRWPA